MIVVITVAAVDIIIVVVFIAVCDDDVIGGNDNVIIVILIVTSLKNEEIKGVRDLLKDKSSDHLSILKDLNILWDNCLIIFIF